MAEEAIATVPEMPGETAEMIAAKLTAEMIAAEMSSRSSESSDIDYEGIPVLSVGQKKVLKISTYIEIHDSVIQLVKILEEVFEMGIMKGTAKRYKVITISSGDEDN